MGRILGVLEANGVHLSEEPRRQVLLLDEQFLSMQQEITTLQAENLKLKADNGPLERENERLKKKLQLKDGLHLSELENNILKHLCRPTPQRGERVQDFLGVVAHAVQVNETRARVFLVKLIQRDLVVERADWRGGTFYVLTDDGKTYCVEQGWA